MEYLEVLKVALVYFLMIVILRVLGKREVGELSIFDLVIILLLANIASLGLDNPDFFILSIISLITLMLLQKLISYILLHKAALRDIIEGKPRVIVFEGKILYKNMKKEKYTIDDLVSQAREKDITNIGSIYIAILETNGKLAVFDKKIELQIISSGRFVKENLELLNINKKYIIKYLSENNIVYKKVLYASVLNNDFIYFCKKNKKYIDIMEKKLKLM